MWWREAGHGAGKVGIGKALISHTRASVLNVVDGESLTLYREKQHKWSVF